MGLVGFDKAIIGVMDKDKETFSAENIMTIDASTSKGVLSANIQNLSAAKTPIYGSNQLVMNSGKGMGQPTCTFAANSIPHGYIEKLNGLIAASTGAMVMGKDTDTPNSAILLISNVFGNDSVKAYLALLKGTWAMPDLNPQTNQAQQTNNTDSMTFTGLERLSDGYGYLQDFSDRQEFDEQALMDFIFPKTVIG